ncbi:hypothetical protein BLNAU_1204 [Blattamonas nauphoetae]|uniref:Uncharacterized protein n=1 Tax=Blattamonas nauphoetae TaxID=2049346 RepID=A0ABQ9YIQ8_9EUKA|nr:hypothetical protein BLNAU_1204 [Blattamonas nauphoetae]
MQYSPMNQMIPPLSPTNRRAKTRRMRQIQLPECAEDVIGNLHRYPLLVWYDPTASNDSEDSLLNDNHTKTLRSFVGSKCETDEEIEWHDLMEWFVCTVIGLNSKASWYNDSFLFDWDDVVVDVFGTARINIFASHSDSSPPHSPQSFSDCITHLSFHFILLIDQLSTSNCLPKHLEEHSPKQVVLSVLHHLFRHLVNTGHLIPTWDPSEFNALVSSVIATYVEHLPDDPNFFDDWKWMAVIVHALILPLENAGVANHSRRLTDSDADPLSPRLVQFIQLLDPELVEMKKRFDPNLIEEARRIKSWKEFLQKVASGEEVQNDTSFLKLSFFRPTLLSLQAKFQQLTSSLDGSDENSTSSLHSSHSSPNTSLAAHLDSSLRTNSSSSHFKQESLELLNILHSLLTSPLPPSLHKHFPIDHFGQIITPVQLDDISPTERFHSSLFDEADNEKLTRSLIRCHSVCELVGDESCILDIPDFFDRTVSVLGSSNTLLRANAFSLFLMLVETSSVIPLLPGLWDRLRSAFHDGQHEENFALIRISTNWIEHNWESHSLPPFPANQFDWDGLIMADLRNGYLFIYSIILIGCIRHCSIKDEIGHVKSTQIILSFERHQRAVDRIVSIFDGTERVDEYLQFSQALISYCLLISLLLNCAFPPTLTSFIAQHAEIDGSYLHPLTTEVFLLCHTSLNPHKPHQPPLDIFCERTLRACPLEFYVLFGVTDHDLPPSLLNTSLCGFHALCRRGVHLDLMEAEAVRHGHHLANTFWMFTTPLISLTFDLFLYFPPPLVTRFFVGILSSNSNPSSLTDPLRLILTPLLFTTAPFGDCICVRELYRSVNQRNNDDESSLVGFVTSHCHALEWLNIPTGFGSALAHSNTRKSFDADEGRDSLRFHTDLSLNSSLLPTTILVLLSKQVHNTRDRIYIVGNWSLSGF